MAESGRSLPLGPEPTLSWERSELGRLPSIAPVLFGSSIVQRLFDDPEVRSDYGETWRPAVDALWRWASGDTTAFYDISKAVADYLVSPFHHCKGQDGPTDADTSCVAATLYRAASMLFGGADGAVLAARVAVDAAMEAAELRSGQLLQLGDLNTADEVQRELRLQVDALRLITEEADGLRRGRASEPLLRVLGRR